MTEDGSRTASAPGKVILGGEHAVVYGQPAAVAAIDARITVTAVPLEDPILAWGPEGRRLPWQDIERLARDTEARLAAFRAGRLPIAAVLDDPEHLLPCAVGRFLSSAGPLPCAGLRLTVASELPPGAGLGSSAALLAALHTVLDALAGTGLDADARFRLVLAGEGLVHGNPSGVDPAVAVYGGSFLFRRDEPRRPLSLEGRRLRLIHTGRPASGTGECVAFVASRTGRHGRWERFGDVARRTAAALADGDREALVRAVRENHRLLVELGVVPAAVQALVASLERAGGAGKICGAGAVRGDAAGAVLVVPDDLPLDEAGTLASIETTVTERGAVAP